MSHNHGVSRVVALLQRSAYARWLTAVLAFGFIGTAIIFVSYNEFLDCSNPATHESANTPLGWATAGIATGVPLLIGVVWGLRHDRRLVVVALLVAAVQAVVWVWALTGPGRCEFAGHMVHETARCV